MYRLADGGPLYFETDLDRFFVEPVNAVTSLTFLIPVIYLLFRLRGRYREFPFLIYWASPLLAIGGIGSAIYHAFRASTFFLIMDVLPIALLTLSVSIYFWNKILPHWAYIIVVIAGTLLIRFVAFGFLEGHAAINLSYFITGVMIFLPALIFLFRTNFHQSKSLAWSVLFLLIALLFRWTDDFENQIFAAGTHWLWHIFTTAGALALAVYLIHIKDLKLGTARMERVKY